VSGSGGGGGGVLFSLSGGGGGGGGGGGEGGGSNFAREAILPGLLGGAANWRVLPVWVREIGCVYLGTAPA